MERQKKILVVDDQSPIRYIIKQMLTQLGHVCVLVTSGEEALSTLNEEDDLSLLLCDIHMKGMTGLEVLESCKIMNPKLPVVLMSAYSKDETIIDALRKGASDYLIKPFEIAQLSSVIQRVEELYHNRDQIIDSRELIDNLVINMGIPSKDLEVYKVQALLKNTIQIYSDMSTKELLNLSLVMEEAILNAHEHGNLELVSEWKEEFIGSSSDTRFDIAKQERMNNPNYCNRTVKIQLSIYSNKVAISVEDEGKGYPISTIESNASGKPFGMGLMLIKNLSDNISFNEKGNRITFEKFIVKERNENSDS